MPLRHTILLKRNPVRERTPDEAIFNDNGQLSCAIEGYCCTPALSQTAQSSQTRGRKTNSMLRAGLTLVSIKCQYDSFQEISSINARADLRSAVANPSVKRS